MAAIIWFRTFYEHYCTGRKIVYLSPVSDDMDVVFLKDHSNVVKLQSWISTSYCITLLAPR